MSVNFSTDRMAEVFYSHDQWWKGALDRPLAKIFSTKKHASSTPALCQANCADFSRSAREVIEELDEEFSYTEFLGDAFPSVDFSAFGPGVLAAFVGAKLDNSSGRVWFFPEKELPIEKIHVKYDPENKYVLRIKELYEAGIEKWKGKVILSFPDLGGVMDVAATLRGSENLLLDLYDAPEEVIRLNNEIQTAWYEAYNDFYAILKEQKYITDWNGLLSSKPAYVLQCDFCYMIGNAMFREFVLPTLLKDTEALSNTIYHLDGIGELAHLDTILSIKNLNAVQWVFGAGQKDSDQWDEVHEKIVAAGKQLMLTGTPEANLRVIEKLHIRPYISHGVDEGETALIRRLLSAR